MPRAPRARGPTTCTAHVSTVPPFHRTLASAATPCLNRPLPAAPSGMDQRILLSQPGCPWRAAVALPLVPTRGAAVSSQGAGVRPPSPAVRAQGMEADGATASALIISLCQANQASTTGTRGKKKGVARCPFRMCSSSSEHTVPAPCPAAGHSGAGVQRLPGVRVARRARRAAGAHGPPRRPVQPRAAARR